MSLPLILRVRASRLIWRLTDAVALDVRSVAASRIALGVLVLLDLRERFSLLVDFYTDAGLVTRVEAASLWAQILPETPHPWSLHLLSGSAAWQGLLFGVEGLCAMALIVGYRTRIASILCYVLLLSLCQRDVLVTGGDEWMLAAFLFWAMFMPLDGAFSIESMRRPRSPTHRSVRLSTLGTFAFTAQLLMILVFAGLQKVFSSSAWRGGDAIHMVLKDIPASDFGLWLGRRPLICSQVLNYGVLGAELVAPWLLVTRVSSRVRTFSIVYIGANLLGFAAALRVGRLPWVALAALIAHLPSGTWQKLGVGVRRPDGVESSVSAPSSLRTFTIVRRLAIGALFVHAFAYNVARIGKDEAEPAWLEAPAGFIVPRQGWGMFRAIGAVGVPEWVVVSAARHGDATPTIRLPDGHPLGFGPDSSVTRLEGNQRWGYFWARAPMLARHYPDILQRYMERECNRLRPETRLSRIEIVVVRRSGPELEKETIATRRCDDAPVPIRP